MFFINQFILGKRTELKMSRKSLINGLCSEPTLLNYENGKSTFNKFMTDALLQRLGVSEDFFEHYVTSDDIAVQNQRMEILDVLDNKEFESLSKLIDAYMTLHKSSNLHKQFCGYIACLQSVDINEQIDLYLQTIKLTVPEFEEKPLVKLFLTNIECQLIFEYANILMETDMDKGSLIMTSLLEYFSQDNIENGIKSKFYPKVILVLCNDLMGGHEYIKALSLLNSAILYLRKTAFLRDLPKLISTKIEVLNKLLLKNTVIFVDNTRVEINCELLEMENWQTALNDMSKICNISLTYENFEYRRIFTWHNYYKISDVISGRRAMYSMSQEELAGDICDTKTISRIENGKTNIYPKIATQILKKLHLTGELYSDNIVTSDYDTFVLSHETSTLMMLHDYKTAGENITILKEKLDMTNTINQQYILHKETIIKVRHGEITNAEHLKDLLYALELTVPLENILKSNNVFLTKKEVILLCNIINVLEKLKQFNLMMRLLEYFEDNYLNNKNSEESVDVLDMVFLVVAGKYANMNKFNKSNLILNIHESAMKKTGNFSFINSVVYEKSWNYHAEIQYEKQEFTPEMQKKYKQLLDTDYILSEILFDKYIRKLITADRRILH